MEILVCVYLVVGLVLSFYWFNRDHLRDYEEAEKTDMVEKGAAVLLLLILWVLWPIVLIKNIIKNKRI